MKRIFKYVFAATVSALIWAIVVVYGTLAGWWHKPITKKPTKKSFIAAATATINKEFVGNFAMAMMKDGIAEQEIFYSHKKRVDRNTIFQVASLSKFVSALGIMKLSELGKIHLDTPVSRYLTRWQLPPSEFDNGLVTARRLLSHTAGLTDELGYSGFLNRDSVQKLEESLTKASDADEGISGEVRVGIEPGSQWKYSGGGFTLLQLLVEETSGQSFNDFMADNLFEPLNMTSSTYLLSDSLQSRLCEFYNSDKTPAAHFYYTSLAATSLYTSMADLETLFQFLLKGKGDLLTQESLRLMRESHWEVMGEKIFGLGCMLYIDIENDEHIFGHDGHSTPPINTAIRINPVTSEGIIVLETGNPDLASRIASDWVFAKTGKVDTLLFLMQMNKMVKLLFAGLILVALATIATGVLKRKKIE